MAFDFSWLKSRLGELIELTPSLLPQGDVYVQGPWTALKEVFLAGYVAWIYSVIIPKMSWVKRFFFIDPFSGPGLTQVEESDIMIGGSPVVAALASRAPFDRMYLGEKASGYRKSLERRMSYLKPGGVEVNFRPVLEDCNVCVETAAESLRSGDHFLAFVDPEGMELSWLSFAKLLKRPGDIIYTFQTRQIARLWGLAGRELENGAETEATKAMDRFYGGRVWASCFDADGLLLKYIEKIAATGRQVTRTVRVGGTKYHYDLIFATRKTKAENPWIKGVDRLKARIEAHTEESVQLALNILSGKQLDLEGFFNPNESSAPATRFR